MPLKSIVVIVLRLFALNWLLYDVTLWTIAFLSLSPSVSVSSQPGFIALYAPPSLILLAAILIWLLAPLIARLVSPDPDATVDLSGLSLYHLYCFGFVFLGLYFILSSFADVINWIHYFAMEAHNSAKPDPQGQSLYQASRPALTFVGGLISLLGAPRWARKLLRREEKIRAV